MKIIYSIIKFVKRLVPSFKLSLLIFFLPILLFFWLPMNLFLSQILLYEIREWLLEELKNIEKEFERLS